MSDSLVASAIHNRTRQDYGLDGDELMFGDFCFTCGNATLGTPYCSRECRLSDSNRTLASPEFSPALSAVPLLVESSKSVCSTPPSSLNNSPSPPSEGLPELSEPPPLDLPALATKFDYGGTSLPVGFRFPLSYAIAYDKDVTYPAKELKSASAGLVSGFDTLDLKYRRKPTPSVPAPLYFRQSAAAVQPASPITGPLSPRPRFSPRFSPARVPTTSTSFAVPSALSLPPAVASVPSSFSDSDKCGRPGCAGSNPTSSKIPGDQRATSTPAQSAVAAMKHELRRGPTSDLLMSPRIRALRGSSDIVGIAEEEEDIPEINEAGTHSAFACYLFSHLTTGEPSDEEIASGTRGRTVQQVGVPTDGSRSASVDSTFVGRGTSTVAAKSRASRFVYGGRGAPEKLVPTPEVESLTLTPGRFIAATDDSPSPSPFGTSPSSPPTLADRGRASARRNLPAEPSSLANSFDPRGRSKLRGPGAVERDLSPVRDSSESASRGRSSAEDNSRERGRQPSRSRARDEERCRPVGSAAIEEEEEDEERGRQVRSRSRLRRGRGREVIISGAAYGHGDSP